MRLKEALGDIQTNGANFSHGRLLRVMLNTSLWHVDAVRGRPPHHPLQTLETCDLKDRFRRQAILRNTVAGYQPRDQWAAAFGLACVKGRPVA